MKKILPLLFLLLFSFCSKKEKQFQYPQINVPDRENPIKVNTKTMLHMALDNDCAFFVGNFVKDTTIVKNHSSIPDKYYKRFKWDTIFPHYDFKIIIDTTYTIAANGFEYKNINLKPNGFPNFKKVFALWKDYVVCYPLLIYNNGNTPAYSDAYTKLIQEAKDTDGKWKPIEFFAGIPSCIPKTNFYEYLPRKYSSLSIIKYHGDFKTKIRVKIKIGKYVYYSNEIEGYINKTQFDKDVARNMLKFFCQFCDGRSPVSEERVSNAFLENKEN